MVSIITVTYNAEACLEKTVKSVINQTYKDIEYIIIDGGSYDKTLSIINNYRDKIKYWISEPDKGIYDAMNKGLKIAKGDYVNFLNAGDCYYKNNVLSDLFDNLDQSIDLLYGDSYLIDQNGVTVRLLKAGVLNRHTVKKGMAACHQSIFIKRQIAPYYNINYKYNADYNWIIEVVMKNRKILYKEYPVVYYVLDGFSAKYFKKNFIEYIKIVSARFGVFQNIINLPHYLRIVAGKLLRDLLKVKTLRLWKKV